MEESEWGREGLAEGLDLVSSCVVDGDELRYAFQEGLVRLGSSAEDSREMAPVFDEDPITDSCRGYKNVSPGSASQDTQDQRNDCMRSTSALTRAKLPWLRTVLSASSLGGRGIHESDGRGRLGGPVLW